MCVQAYNAKAQQRYSTTKTLGYTAAVLSVVNIAYTGIVSTVIIGVSIACSKLNILILHYYCDFINFSFYYQTVSSIPTMKDMNIVKARLLFHLVTQVFAINMVYVCEQFWSFPHFDKNSVFYQII